MENTLTYRQRRILELHALKNRIEIIRSRMSTFTIKYNELLRLMNKTDGNIDKLPESFKNIGDDIDNIKTSVRGIDIINGIKRTGLVIAQILASEMSSVFLCNKYESSVDELLVLYRAKDKAMMNKKINSQVTNEVSEYGNNYKVQALNILNLYSTYGVTDENEIKSLRGRTSKLDKKSQDCFDTLNSVINNISPTAVSANDIVKIKEVLTKLGRMNMLTDEGQNREYEVIEKYIGELAGRNMRIIRDKGEDTTEKNANQKFEAIQTLGLYETTEVREEDLLKLADIKEESLDMIGKSYVRRICEVINNIATSSLLAEDIIKIKEILIQIGNMSSLDVESQRRTYDHIDEYIEKLSKRKGRGK